MAYKISGSTYENSRIIVINKNDWSIESTNSGTLGSFELTGLTEGQKIILARNDLGKITAFGNISPVQAGGNKGIFSMGSTTGDGYSSVIDEINMDSLGDAQKFGDAAYNVMAPGSTSNGINDRGVFGGGSPSLIIQYVTISSASNSTFFGNLTTSMNGPGAVSNNTNDRGVFGETSINYITISSTGNAASFGNMSVNRTRLTGTSNGTNDRGVFANGYSSTYLNVIDYVTISTTGNATNFGDTSLKVRFSESTSDLTNNRGLIASGYTGASPYHTNVIEYITISTPSNATDFGDLSNPKWDAAGTSNGENERGLFGGGYTWGAGYTTSIDYVTITTLGNASSFGNLSTAKASGSGTSNA